MMKVKITEDANKFVEACKDYTDLTIEANLIGEIVEVEEHISDDENYYMMDGSQILKSLCEPVEETYYLKEAWKNFNVYEDDDMYEEDEDRTRELKIIIFNILKHLEQNNEKNT
jgi:hypothetical protein